MKRMILALLLLSACGRPHDERPISEDWLYEMNSRQTADRYVCIRPRRFFDECFCGASTNGGQFIPSYNNSAFQASCDMMKTMGVRIIGRKE